jgi:hypothetical protein
MARIPKEEHVLATTSACPGCSSSLSLRYILKAAGPDTVLVIPASCTSDLSDFPVLVKVTDASLKSAANGGHVGSPNGYDIVFRAADGATVLDHEIERYVPTTGELAAG